MNHTIQSSTPAFQAGRTRYRAPLISVVSEGDAMGILGKIISLLSSGPAIQNLDRIDMKIDFKDGGILLPVVVSQHLDGSLEVAALIRTKLETYIRFIESGELSQAKYVKVQLNCVKKPDPEAIKVIECFKARFNNMGAELSWKS